MSDEDPAALAKPDELLALHGVTAELFDTLRAWFDVPDAVMIDLRAVDSAVAELGDPLLIAAMAMRKLQALHLLATPGVRTTTDVVIAIVQDLDRALLQAPGMRLRLRAAATDWDAAFEELESGALDDVDADERAALEAIGLSPEEVGAVTGPPTDVSDVDPEAERFRFLHAQLHAALIAIVDASEGEIRIFE